MARYIDAEDFYKRQAKRCNYNSPIIGTCTMDNITLREALKKQPTADVVEVVRCKDCRHFEYSQINNRGFRICQASKMDITENDFCSYGERRKDDE